MLSPPPPEYMEGLFFARVRARFEICGVKEGADAGKLLVEVVRLEQMVLVCDGVLLAHPLQCGLPAKTRHRIRGRDFQVMESSHYI